MPELLNDGRLVDLALLLTVVEGLLLVAYHRRTGRGVAPADLAANLAAGACLMLALRAALVGAGPTWIVACLVGSLLAHLLDLSRRWRR